MPRKSTEVEPKPSEVPQNPDKSKVPFIVPITPRTEPSKTPFKINPPATPEREKPPIPEKEYA